MNEDWARAEIERCVSRETIERLHIYVDLLHKWQKRINLVSPRTASQVWSRHFLDSVQLWTNAPKDEGSTWVDLGSGGGFPGLVLAILRSEDQNQVPQILVESDTRKCGFLREVARQTDVEVVIKNNRIEQVPPLSADVITARALAPLPKLINLALPHANPNATLLFPKGETWRDELESLDEGWQTSATVIPSQTDPNSTLLRFQMNQNMV